MAEYSADFINVEMQSKQNLDTKKEQNEAKAQTKIVFLCRVPSVTL